MADPGQDPTTSTITGAQSLIRSLEAAGVDTIFGIPGGAILPAYDPLFDSSVRHVLVRHEQGAGHAATGYAQATGRVGVCTRKLCLVIGSVMPWMSASWKASVPIAGRAT